MNQPFRIKFADGQTAKAIHVYNFKELPAAVTSIGLQAPRPTLVLVGGAGDMGASEMNRLRPLFVETLAPLAESLQLAVIDGGTEAGVMRLMGQARHEIGASFPLVGVAAIGTVKLPNTDIASESQQTALEPNHSHFVFAPGKNWGDESVWLAKVANVMARDKPSVTLLVGGGKIAHNDVDFSLENERPVLVVTGSGRYADELGNKVTKSPLIKFIALDLGLRAVTTKIEALLREESRE